MTKAAGSKPGSIAGQPVRMAKGLSRGSSRCLGRGVGPSIVGGQPAENGRGAGPTVSVGVERVLYLAATDGAFQAALLEDRAAALEDRELLLEPEEQAILVSVSGEALASMIQSLRPPNHGRRRFMKAVAAASVVGGAAGVALSSGCVDDDLATGIRPEEDAAVDAGSDADPTDGGGS